MRGLLASWMHDTRVSNGVSAGRSVSCALGLAGVDWEVYVAKRRRCGQLCQRGLRQSPPLERLAIRRSVAESHG